jgi:ssDNA-binding Zn-finger/Zn-ribbon topoisomerase 1
MRADLTKVKAEIYRGAPCRACGGRYRYRNGNGSFVACSQQKSRSHRIAAAQANSAAHAKWRPDAYHGFPDSFKFQDATDEQLIAFLSSTRARVAELLK